MANTGKPDRLGGTFVKNYEGRAIGSHNQGKKPSRKTASTVLGTESQPNNTPEPGKNQSDAIAKSGYKRATVGVRPKTVPLKRQAEGSVLTKGSNPQPFNKTTK